MNTIPSIIFYFFPIIGGTFLLIFWRYLTEHDTLFPTRFHILIYFIISLIPGFGFILFVIAFGFYFGLRITDNITIKPNKFTNFWFDKNNNNETN